MTKFNNKEMEMRKKKKKSLGPFKKGGSSNSESDPEL